MQGLAVCQNGKNTWSFVWLHPLLTSGFPLGMTSPNVTASLCFLVCVLVSATSAIPASSSLLPLLPRIYFLRYSCSIVNFPLSLLLLPLSSLPPLRSFLCCIRYPCFLASAPSPPLPRLRCLLPSFLCHFRYPSSLQPASDLGHRRGLRYWPRRPSVRVSFSWGMSRCTDGGAEGSLGGVWVLVKILMGVMCSCFCWLVLG